MYFKYNTTPFTNITNKPFFAKYDGVEFEVAPEETRYWPSALARHAADQLVNAIQKSSPSDATDIHGRPIHSQEYRAELIRKILGTQEMTATPDTPMSFKEEVAAHEAEYAKLLEVKRKKDVENKAEALKEAEKNNE